MTEDQIVAYVDGELGPIEALRFERAMEADAALAAAVGRHRALRERIADHFAPVAAEAIPPRLAATVDRSSPVAAFPARPRRWFDSGGRYAAIAATLVAGLVVGQMLPRGTNAPVGEQRGAIVAQGALAAALDGDLAAAPGDGPYRIGVSFVSRDRRYCRTFSSGAGAGLGCRGPEGWALVRFVAGTGGEGQGAYRQAGSASADVLEAAQAMMAGDPLDADAERRARGSGWRLR
nr:hypothetical protein [Sphingomonas sp. Y57]